MKSIILCFTSVLCVFGSIHAQSQTVKTGERQNENNQFEKFRIGGYGEMLYQYMDYGVNRMSGNAGSPSDKRSEVSIPRFIVAMDYKFTSSLILSSEIEFEYGGTGSALEFDAQSEGGEFEYEIEKGGEIALEQFHLTKIFSKEFSIRVGHLIVPVGLTNAHHEPIHFFGTTRPESETTVLPSTWHETGLSVLGRIWKFGYEIMLVNGLDPNLFNNSGWISGARQARYEVAKFTHPAIAGRVDFYGIPNTRIGISGYYGNTGKNASRVAKMKDVKGTISILSADGTFKNKSWIARANFIYGNLSDSDIISQRNTHFPKDMGFPRTVVAQNALSYGLEAGYNIGRHIYKKLNLYPFLRYEYYNTMEKTVGSVIADPRYKCETVTAGLNYYILPNLVAKADYKHRRIDHGHFNNENTVSIGFAYIGWFFSK